MDPAYQVFEAAGKKSLNLLRNEMLSGDTASLTDLTMYYLPKDLCRYSLG